MTTDELHLPSDALARFEEFYRALLGGPKKVIWYESREALRFSALALTPLRGEPAELAERLREVAEELLRGTPWYGNLRSSIRFLVAAMLQRNHTPVAKFLEEVERASPLFRKHWRFSGNVHEALAILILMQHADGGHVQAAEVDRLEAIWRRMKDDHPWLTHKSDWPAAALLTTAPGEPELIGRRLEALYQELRRHKFSLGDQLQTASQILHFHRAEPEAVGARFAALHAGFKSRGLWMYEGDYDELALLSFTEQPEEEVVELVSAHRERIAALAPAPSKQTSFTLACGTATIALVSNADSSADLGRMQALALIQLILQAQAAVVASTAGGSAAAGASG